eukprot:943682-Alexandrium_andersonii.AAC.1
MSTFAAGVPVGLAVDLPRTPAAFPPKARWSLGGRATWGGDTERAAEFQGRTQENYASLEQFAAE